MRKHKHITIDFPEWCAKLIGLDVNDAKEFLAVDDWVLRVVKRDGQVSVVTRDYRTDRVNVEVEAGVIVKVKSIG